jgi:HEPN domain-containing protein
MADARARAFLAKAQEYLASAEDNLELERFTVAAGAAIHAGICAKDAIVVALVGRTGKAKDHGAAVKELRQALGQREQAASAERALRELVVAKPDVEYGAAVVTSTAATALVRRARTLTGLAVEIVRLGR